MARLIFNGGSSSWKCGLYDVAADARAEDAAPPIAEVRLAWSRDDDDASVTASGPLARREFSARIARGDAVPAILAALRDAGAALDDVEEVGHRIVHGANVFVRTTRLDAEAIERMRALEPFAPSHNPVERGAIEAVRRVMPDVRQYAVFDTQFHRTLSREAYVYPGPYAWVERDIRRYGFHGTSVAYAAERVAAMLGRPLPDTNVLVAHLGGGCSVTAVRNGTSADTSMGFTPLDGTMMATRSGGIDPGIAIFLMREAARHGETADAFATDFERALNHGSGLRGISGVSDDLRAVRAASRSGNQRARLALGMFARRLAATIGGLATNLDRVDALVFTGGIGENAADVRDDTCARLRLLGVTLDPDANARGAVDVEVTGRDSRVRAFVIKAREEWFIAREGARLPAP